MTIIYQEMKVKVLNQIFCHTDSNGHDKCWNACWPHPKYNCQDCAEG